MAQPAERNAPVDSVVRELAERFSGRWDDETIERCVAESYAEVARDARITSFLPALTRRRAHHLLLRRPSAAEPRAGGSVPASPGAAAEHT